MRATIARMKQLEYALCHVQCKMFKLKVFPVKAFALNNYFFTDRLKPRDLFYIMGGILNAKYWLGFFWKCSNCPNSSFYLDVALSSFWKMIGLRGVFRTAWNIYVGVFFTKIVNGFYLLTFITKKVNDKCSIRPWKVFLRAEIIWDGFVSVIYPFFFDLQPKSPNAIKPAASSPTSKINFSFKYNTIVQHDFAKTRYVDAADFAFVVTNWSWC